MGKPTTPKYPYRAVDKGRPVGHLYESHYYDSTLGFQTVWQALCRPIPGYLQGLSYITRTHVYLLTKVLKESLLSHRYTQGLASLIGLSKRCEKIPELFYLTGLEILKNIPNSHVLCSQFYKNMFLACAYQKEEILLSFALYLVLRQQDVTDALELLKSKCSYIPFNHNYLHKAYIALFEYALWHPQATNDDKLVKYQKDEDILFFDEEQDDEFGEKPTTQRVDYSAIHAIHLFEEVFSLPGVWDMFVPAYLDLLENLKGLTETRQFLESYRDKNPLNPNAHRYLYYFLKSHSHGTDAGLIKVLEDLIKLDPTTECLTDLINLKIKTGSKEHIIELVFEKLDHAASMWDEETWKILESCLIPQGGSELESELEKEAKLCWKERESWWPPYHFRIPRDFSSSHGLAVMLSKAYIAEYFLGKDNEFSKEVRSKYGVYTPESSTNEHENSSADKIPSGKRPNNNTEIRRSKRRKR